MAPFFDFHKRLGKGNFGEVWLVTDLGLNTKRALKLIPPEKLLDSKNLFREAKILKEAEHPNVVRVEETGIMKDKRIYIAMEYLSKGSIDDEAKGSYVDLSRAKNIMIDALRGLEHAHSKNIIHRDIKPANILIGNNNEGILSDFGLAVPKNVDWRSSDIKDYIYIAHMAPELFKIRNYNVASDIYAAGVTLYRLVNGDSFLPSLTFDEIRKDCISGKYPNRKAYRAFVPNPLRRLINKAINLDPKKRYKSASKMRHALEQVNIQMNWKEMKTTNGYIWRCSWGNRCYQVKRTEITKSKWSVETMKGKSKSTLRRVMKYCNYNLTKSDSNKMACQILQDFVLGRIN